MPDTNTDTQRHLELLTACALLIAIRDLERATRQLTEALRQDGARRASEFRRAAGLGRAA
jgi:hypothetical protein